MYIFGLLIVLLVYLILFYVTTLEIFSSKAMVVVFLAAGLLLWLGGLMPGWLFWPVEIYTALLAAFIYSPILRRKLLWSFVFSNLKENLPHISKTEQVAADAGGVWWEQELFNGAPDWSKLFSLPRYEFRPEEQSFLDNEVAQLCALIDRSKIEKSKAVPKEVWDFIKKHRFLALVMPEEYGGCGYSHRLHAEVVSRLAVCSAAVAVTVMVPNSLGPAELIIKYGSSEQRKNYLARLAEGKEIPCFGLTSKTAGSDASGILDTGVICKGMWQEQEVIGLRLNWSKRYITLAPVATLIGLAVKVQDPDGLLPEDHHLHGQVDLGITCVLAAADLPGIEIGRRHNPMDVRFLNGPISGKDVFVPLDHVIGGAEMVGEGWRMLMECLAVGRCISLPALSVAANQLALASTSAYARARTQFGRPLASFEAVAEQNATIALNALTTTAAASMATDVLDNGHNSAVMSAMVKLYCTEAYRDSVNRAMDVHAGRAVMSGARNYLDELYRSIPVAITVEGSNILLRGLVIFGQGMLRCHPYLREEIDRGRASDTLDKDLAQVFDNHIGHLTLNKLRILSHAWSGGLLGPEVSSKAPKAAQRQISWLCAQLSFLAEVCLKLYSGDFKRRELVSGRFAQAWVELFCATAVLRYQHIKGGEQRLGQICELAVKRCLYNAQGHLLAVIDNLPMRWLTPVHRAAYVPVWSRPKPPSEAEMLAVSEALADPEGLRRSLCDRLFATLEYDLPSHPLQPVEDAMHAFAQLENMRDRLPEHLSHRAFSEGLGTILDDPAVAETLGDDGVRQWRECSDTIMAAMEVDDFDGKLA